MSRRSSSGASVLGIGAVLLFAPVVLADTCCANAPVTLDPASAMPGVSVWVIGLRCLNADNTGPLPLNLGSFWLWPGQRAAEADPDTVPGAGLPADLPPVEEWPPFDRVTEGPGGSGDAVRTIPVLPDGTYQLWWWCDDGSGPGGGIHYSTGQRLTIGAVPDTATSELGVPEAADPRGWAPGCFSGSEASLWYGPSGSPVCACTRRTPEPRSLGGLMQRA